VGVDSIERVIVEADGGSRGNPGPAGYGAVIIDSHSGMVLAERSAAIGVSTNNVAEYSGLIAGLEAAAELGARQVDVRMDSKLVIEQMSNRWKIKNPGLRPLATRARDLVRGFDEVTFTWVPRERNARADALANAAMDAAAEKSTATQPPPSPPPAQEPSGEPAQETGQGTLFDAIPGPEAALSDTAPSDASPADAARTEADSSGASAADWEPRLTAPTRLILLRHGETEYSAARRYCGHGDIPLIPHGEEQVRAAAREIQRLAPEVAAIISSPLSRARQSAELVAAAYPGVPVEIDPGWIECDFGAWEGLTFAEVRQQWPRELDAWLADTRTPAPAGESFEMVRTRTRAAARALRERYQGRTVVVVSHVTPIKLLLCDALDAGRLFLSRLHLDPAGISIVDSWPDGGISVRLINAVPAR